MALAGSMAMAAREPAISVERHFTSITEHSSHDACQIGIGIIPERCLIYDCSRYPIAVLITSNSSWNGSVLAGSDGACRITS